MRAHLTIPSSRAERVNGRRPSMPHIALPEGVPGIRSLFQFRPETARPLLELAEVLLRGENTLSSAQREMIAARVSRLNACRFCASSHRAAAAHHQQGDYTSVDAVLADPDSAEVAPAFRALLAIAGKVALGGGHVAGADVQAARDAGASDVEIHDTVLIAAAFCMFNRYVDGLAAWTPTDPAAYDEMGTRMAQVGYAARLPVGSA